MDANHSGIDNGEGMRQRIGVIVNNGRDDPRF
jgi:hypothetical protein